MGPTTEKQRMDREPIVTVRQRGHSLKATGADAAHAERRFVTERVRSIEAMRLPYASLQTANESTPQRAQTEGLEEAMPQ